MSADETLADLHRLIIQHFGWDDAHNYFFSQGCDRYEDPLLFATQDRVSARCRRIYCAADVPLSRVFSRPEEPLYYTYALPNGRELKIVLDDTVALKLFG
nr:plasmid pRiA4b ORF-3 family protein [Adlercreutzia rubneri]